MSRAVPSGVSPRQQPCALAEDVGSEQKELSLPRLLSVSMGSLPVNTTPTKDMPKAVQVTTPMKQLQFQNSLSEDAIEKLQDDIVHMKRDLKTCKEREAKFDMFLRQSVSREFTPSSVSE